MSEKTTPEDRNHMEAALRLATNGQGRVSPNPPVGCVIVGQGRVVGQGWHDRLGGLHAEAMALAEAGEAARGATVYVTLSPCTTHGRQPPCADALIRAGVGRVAIAAEDPNVRNSSGAQVLREAGIQVDVGLLRTEAEYVARGFFAMMRRGRPYLTLKYAMTLDGKIAAAGGDSRWVSGPESREMVQDMRSRSDAVLVGSGTALADDPLLTVRDPVWTRRGGEDGHRQPLRVVADTRARTRPTAALFVAARGPAGRVVVAVGESANEGAATALVRAGAEIVRLPETDGRIDLEALLRRLGEMGVNEVLCEGGGGLAAGLFRAGLVDEVTAFIAPKCVGGADAPGPVASLGLRRMADAIRLTVRECKFVGGDILIRAGVEDAFDR